MILCDLIDSSYHSHAPPLSLYCSPVPPAVSLSPTMLASQGDSLTLDCQPTGNPPPSLSWFKDGQPLAPDDDRLTVSHQTVVITSLYSIDQGNYSCLATSTQGTARASTFLTVLGEPTYLLSPCVLFHLFIVKPTYCTCSACTCRFL